ncbi:hypothetical protein [Deinococcus fonticola]|uniref:hypothetical protein n=1 Tax=Deinococcus fonticola TaxID=2528713 RepID=UPI001F0E142E|nr:hypothetical protein [Deinococcus fonticola]
MADQHVERVASVWYVELSGPDAVQVLRGVLDALPSQAGFRGAELLSSPAQPQLALIASRWAGEPPSLPVPDGAKHWVFTVLEARP